MVTQEQKVLVREGPDQDVLALVSREERAAVHLFKIREGKLLSQEHFPLTGTAGLGEPEVLAGFMKSYYGRVERPPDEILLSSRPADEVYTVVAKPEKRMVALKSTVVKESCWSWPPEWPVGLEEQLRSRRRRRNLSELARLVGLEEDRGGWKGDISISRERGGGGDGLLKRGARGHYRRFPVEAKPR